MSETSATCQCGETSDGWPGENGAELCQMCWESQCDKSWWQMVTALAIFNESGDEMKRWSLKKESGLIGDKQGSWVHISAVAQLERTNAALLGALKLCEHKIDQFLCGQYNTPPYPSLGATLAATRAAIAEAESLPAPPHPSESPTVGQEK